MAVTGFYWNDGWLRAAAEESYRLALIESAAFARSKASWRHVASTIAPSTGGIVVGSSDAALLEGGAKAHQVERDPRKITKFPDGGFATGPIDHPGFKGSPFMGPTRDAWPTTYVQTAKRVFPG
jgi:hypothetical protein